MEYLAYDLLHLERRVRIMERRVERRALRDVMEPLELPDDEFINLYRISPDMATDLIQALRPHLARQRLYGLSVEKQVLIALRFYSTGSYQNPVGNQEGLTMSQPSVSRCVHAVTDSINDVFLRRKIRFPLTAEERNAARLKFANAMQPFYVYIPLSHYKKYLNRPQNDRMLKLDRSLCTDVVWLHKIQARF
ncbi:uncharacterized protein LOC115878909 [Sitophilus oryzae]|uniref:Uncharacterized protein LOC115878909 n=1 Tax=Sitophilus oryzae TaxID=7048 RepID=A0A6J2XL35_SITOR|nr:uncharacterized protein LOC115878909 [Sitophilus oryzae]